MADKRNLKVAILGSRGIPAKYGGYESFTENLSKNLVKMGLNITVFCPSNNEFKKHIYQGVNLRFLFNFEKLFDAIGTLLYDIFSLIRASFSKFSLIYMLGYSSAWFCIFPRLFGKKIVINTDGLEWKRSKWPKLARIYLKLNEYLATKFANELISDSIEIKKYFIEKYHKDSTYITNGAEVYVSKNKKVLKKFNLKPFEYYLVVARLEPENNLHIIINGFSASNSKKKLFIIANVKKTPYFKYIMKLCRKDKRIVFFGPLYNMKELNEIRANTFAYVHGHSVGGTNPSLLESMGCGSVVIAFDVPFNREVLRENSFFFKNEMELKNVIEKIEKFRKTKITKIGKRNKEIIKKYYSWKKISEEYYRFFTRLLR
jgi:rhamnosyltransferase